MIPVIVKLCESSSRAGGLLMINHPFIDGNKRVAFAVTDVFLRLNGFKIVAPPILIHQQMMALFEHQQFTLNGVESMLQKITKPVGADK